MGPALNWSELANHLHNRCHCVRSTTELRRETNRHERLLLMINHCSLPQHYWWHSGLENPYWTTHNIDVHVNRSPQGKLKQENCLKVSCKKTMERCHTDNGTLNEHILMTGMEIQGWQGWWQASFHHTGVSRSRYSFKQPNNLRLWQLDASRFNCMFWCNWWSPLDLYSPKTLRSSY